MPSPYTGRLNANEIFGSIFNMIISQQVHSDNIDGLNISLATEARADGSLYGDSKLYYATDALHSRAWGADAEATNLLEIERPEDPKCQSITLSIFRQIGLTVDNYLSKRAWSDEGAFSQFTAVMLAWLPQTKSIYDYTTYNAFLGTEVSSKPAQNITLSIPAMTDEASARLRAQKIARAISTVGYKLKDANRDFNDYGFIRAYDPSRMIIVWNEDFITEITDLDLPTIFHNSIFGNDTFKRSMPSRFFGTVNGSGGTTTASNTTVRALVEKEFKGVKCYPGDLLPNQASYEAKETYTVNDKIICKICIVLPPYMSAFEVSTNFFNPRSLTENHYLTWGHNKLEHLLNYPMITITANEAA